MHTANLIRTARSRRTLPSQMRRVTALSDRTASTLDSQDVHRLRVAIRRCRSFASILEEVDPDPAWPRMRRLCRRLFHLLGGLRDAQVAAHWIDKLSLPEDSARATMHRVIEGRAASSSDGVRHALEHFDRREWKALARTLEHRAGNIVPNSQAAQCLVLERYAAVSRLHEAAMRIATPAAWHELRVAVKRLRYGVETVLPARLGEWDKGLRRIQDLLGEIHDLDLLDALLEEGSAAPVDQVASLRHSLTVARTSRVDEYRQRTTGAASVLETWRHGLPRGARVASAVAARLNATARAADAHPTRTTRVTRLALRLFDALSAHAGRADAAHARAILRAAGQLHGIRATHVHSSLGKAAARFVRTSPVPPGWTSGAWELVSRVVRYHRGGEPSVKHRRFAHLPKASQDVVCGMAGILRLAREVDRQGATALHVSPSSATQLLQLHVPGLEYSRKSSVRMAAAQRLLETYLGRQILIERALSDIR